MLPYKLIFDIFKVNYIYAGLYVANWFELLIYPDQAGCVDRCAAKNVTLNHRILGAFMTEQPKIQVGFLVAAPFSSI